MNIKDVMLCIGERSKMLGIELHLFDGASAGSSGISTFERQESLENFLDAHPKKRYAVFGLGKHNGWKTIRNPLRTELNGFVISMVAYVSPSPDLNIYLLRKIGMDIESPPSDLPFEKQKELRASVFHCGFDVFYPELTSIGYGTRFGMNSMVGNHANQGDYWVLGEVNIGRNVLIGANSLIGPGVSIGDHARINTASVVMDDVPSGMIAAGNPAKVIGPRKLRVVDTVDGEPKIAYKMPSEYLRK